MAIKIRVAKFSLPRQFLSGTPFLQKSHQFGKGPRAVADLALLTHAKLGKRLILAFRYKYRIIAKAVGTPFGSNNLTFHAALKLVEVAVQHQRDDRYEPGRGG
jgi:hypothetical protein